MQLLILMLYINKILYKSVIGVGSVHGLEMEGMENGLWVEVGTPKANALNLAEQKTHVIMHPSH